MNMSDVHKTRAAPQKGFKSVAPRRNGPNGSAFALMLAAVWMSVASSFAGGRPVRCPARSSDFATRNFIGQQLATNHLLDFVVIEPKGLGPAGHRFRVVLDSAAQGTESSLELDDREVDLLVSVRDVDGRGGDLDLIIKTARSFTPVGVWVNDHHGGFIKTDASVYSAVLWSESASLSSAHPPELNAEAVLWWREFHFQSSLPRYLGDPWVFQTLFEPPDLEAQLRPTSNAQLTRGPPTPSLARP